MKTSEQADAVRLQQTLRRLVDVRLPDVPAAFGVQVGLVRGFTNVALFPDEAAAVAQAVPGRVATFRAGRGCARAALKELGAMESAIPVGSSGAPVWPRGFVGSIAHTDEIAAAVVARRDYVKGLGVDIESDEPLDGATMLRIVCRPEELIAGCDASAPENLRRGKLIFVIKEAVYKLYWPLAGTFLEFHDLAVTLDETAGSFRAALAKAERPTAGGVRTFAGEFAETEGFLLAFSSIS